MTTFRPRFLMVAGLAGVAGLLTNVNCGSSGGGGTGGSNGSGGTTSTGGKGGTSATGGSGTGGSATGGNSSGGSVGSGGSSSGGSVGSGGSSSGGSAGGASGAGGGSGGTGGANTDGGTQNAALSFLFASGLDGFAPDTYNGSGGNLAAVDGGTPPTLTFDNSVGHPDNGSAKVTATFTDYNQFVASTVNIAPLIDATGKTISAWVMLDPVDGGGAFTAGYAQLGINTTTSYHGATGPGMGLTPGTWTKISIDLTQQAAPFDASQIIQVTVKFATGAKGDSGAFPGPEHCTFHFDTITDGSGGAAPPAVDVNFDHSSQGFAVGSFGAVPDGGVGPTLTFDSTTGSPNAGSIQVALPFSAYNQTYAASSSVAPPANLSGKTIHVQVMLDKTDAGQSAFAQSGYVKVFAQSTGYKLASGTAKGLTAGTWTDLTMNVSTPDGTPTTGYDPTQIIQIGVQFGIGGMPDGGVFGALEKPTLHIDSIVAQ